MCGILCFLNPNQKDLYKILLEGLNELQNRGKDSCGVFSANNTEDWNVLKRFGTINNILKTTSISEKLFTYKKSKFFLIQTRYVTSQQKKYTKDIYDKLNKLIETAQTDEHKFQSFYKESQPLVRNIYGKPLCMIHNGNIKIINKFIQQTIGYTADISDYKTDSALLLDFIEHYIKKNVPMPLILKNIIENIDGAYNLILYYNNYVYVVRDSLGMRPLSFATYGKSVCFSSESSLYNKINFSFTREIKPGEIVICDPNNNHQLSTYGIFAYKNGILPLYSSCALEYVYLSNNKSVFNGILIKDARFWFGKKLWEEESPDFKKKALPDVGADGDVADGDVADGDGNCNASGDYIVSYVPNTAYYAAKGYANNSSLPFYKILSVKKKGRTFIISNQDDRIRALYEKFAINTDEITKGGNFTKRKLILIDDSIVRGNTLLVIVKKLLETNLFSEIHLRSASPPIYFEDYMGIDIPTKEELVANQIFRGNFSLEKNLAELFNVTSVRYLSNKGLKTVLNYLDMNDSENNWCTSWNDGDYPIQFPDKWELFSKIKIPNQSGNGNSNDGMHVYQY